jgi:hypothetical protein
VEGYRLVEGYDIRLNNNRFFSGPKINRYKPILQNYHRFSAQGTKGHGVDACLTLRTGGEMVRVPFRPSWYQRSAWWISDGERRSKKSIGVVSQGELSESGAILRCSIARVHRADCKRRTPTAIGDDGVKV